MLSAIAVLVALSSSRAVAHDGDPHAGIVLNVGYEYDNCYIDMNPGLGQGAFQQFNREFASGYAFTALSGPRTLESRRVQVGLTMRPIQIDESTDAWNETWTHPGEDHWLGPVELPILQGRVRVTPGTDLEAMFSMGLANWYIGGLGLRHAVLRRDAATPVDVSVRETVQVVHAIDTWTLVSVGADATAGRTFELGLPWLTATPYVGLGMAAALGAESDDDVDLDTAAVFSPRATAGLELAAGPVLAGVEGTLSNVNQWNVFLGVRI